MEPDEIAQQQELHEAIEKALAEEGDLPEGRILTGWVVCFETASISSDDATAGHLYGPRGMTSWRALGLCEWTSRFSLGPGEEDE